MANTENLRGAIARREQGEDPFQTVRSLIARQQSEIEAALPGTGVTPERFARIVLTEIRKATKRDGTNPLLEASPASLLGAVMVFAQLGLEPGPLGHAYLVPYGKEITPIIGYRGIVELARRSGQVTSLVARTVHEGDEFDFGYGLDEYVHHKPALKDRGDAYAYYGVAKFKDGGHTVLVMSKEDVERHRNRYAKGWKREDSPWETEFDSMAQKTVIRQMAKWLPMTSEMAHALTLDEKPPPIKLGATLEERAEEVLDDEREAIDIGDAPEVAGRPVDLDPKVAEILDKPETSNNQSPTQAMNKRLEALLGKAGIQGDVLRHAAFEVAYGVTSRNDLDRGQVSALIDVLSDDGNARALLEAANELLKQEEAE